MVAVSVGSMVGEFVEVWLGRGVAVLVTEDVADAVSVGRSVGVRDGSGVGVNVGDAVVDAVAVMVRVAVGVLVEVEVGVSDGTTVNVCVAVGVGDGVRDGSGVTEGDGVDATAVLVARRFSENWVAVWSMGATTGRVVGRDVALSAGVAASNDATGDGRGLAIDSTVVVVASGSGDDIGVEGDSVSATSTDASGDVEMGLAAAGEETACGVAIAVDVASGTGVPKKSVPAGDAAAMGLACSVARRSSATWVSTPGAIVMTGSFGCDDERVRSSARKRLASKAPAATIALVRFKRKPHDSRPASHRW